MRRGAARPRRTGGGSGRRPSRGKAANKISRVEGGRIGIERADLDVLLDIYDASEKDRFWCRDLQVRSKVRRGRPMAGETTLYLGPRWFRAYRDLELGATEIMEVGSEIIPGILQTEAYTRAMFAAYGSEPDEEVVKETVAIRAERRTRLDQAGETHYSFVLSESSLRRQIGGRSVLAGQLRHLAEVSLLPRVTLQVVPFDSQSYQPMSFNFTVFRFGRDMGDDIVYSEMFGGAVYLDKPTEQVPVYPELFGRLRGAALGPMESRSFILELADQFAAQQT
ncbi:MAG TPA: DUF5753 domain-containing protein [Actinokineospora sp.]|nr:DUF5753 domain-containing protein [Actinokineospora sp.]